MTDLTNRVVPDDDDDDTLGPCGCVDYHMADCPLCDRPPMTSHYPVDDDESDWDYSMNRLKEARAQ